MAFRPHDSRNFLRPFVAKCPAIALLDAGRFFFHDSRKNWCPASTVHEQHFSDILAKFRHFAEFSPISFCEKNGKEPRKRTEKNRHALCRFFLRLLDAIFLPVTVGFYRRWTQRWTLDAVSIPGRPATVKSVQRPAIDKRNPDVSAIAGHFLTNGRKIIRLLWGLLSRTTSEIWQGICTKSSSRCSPCSFFSIWSILKINGCHFSTTTTTTTTTTNAHIIFYFLKG